MRSALRSLALLMCMLLVAAACSRPKQAITQAQAEPDQGANALEAAPEATGVPGVAAPVASAATVARGTARKPAGAVDKGYAALNPNANVSQAKKVGQLIKLQSTQFVPNPWVGVTKDEIKLTFARDETNCGVNVINVVSQAGGNTSTGTRFYRPAPTDQTKANKEYEESVQATVDYWNANVNLVADDIPEAKDLMAKLNKPGQNFYGRKIAYSLTDGGSFQCPERTTAGAVRIAQEIKPFSVVVDDIPGINGSGYNLASALNAKAPAASRPMAFGVLWNANKEYEKWAPYVWAQFTSGTQSVKLSASWICAKLNGQNAANSPDYKTTPRKFGLLYPNAQNAKQVAEDFKGFVVEYCGKQIISPDAEFAYSPDLSRAGDEAAQIAVKFKLLGVTSVVHMMDPITPLLQIAGAKSQSYRPEWVWTGNAYTDSSTVQRLYDQEMVDKASIGITPFGVPGGFGYEAGDPFHVWNKTHPKSPKTGKACDSSSDAGMNHDNDYCRAPGAIVTIYYSWLPLIGGIIFAGPELTPVNVTRGLQAYPETRYSANGPTDDPRAALVGAGPGQFYFITDAVEWRWRAKFMSPAPESKAGWVEWTDCQRHYKLWPDRLAVQWEKGGAAYNAWCGDAKFSPANGVEKDNYPRVS